MELLWGEWALSFSIYRGVFAQGSPKSPFRAGCEAEQSPVLRRGQCHTKEILPCPCRGTHGAVTAPEGFCTGGVWDPGTSSPSLLPKPNINSPFQEHSEHDAGKRDLKDFFMAVAFACQPLYKQ